MNICRLICIYFINCQCARKLREQIGDVVKHLSDERLITIWREHTPA